MQNFIQNKGDKSDSLHTLFDWKNHDYYDSSFAWSYRRWAWEFLRRNPDYQTACEKWKNTFPFAWEKSVWEFGRTDLKSYRSSYGNDDRARLWLCERIPAPKGNYGEVETVVDLKLPIGHVSLVFDLRQAEKAGQAALTALLSHAKELLANELAKYEKSLQVHQRSTTRKPRRNLLPIWLRIYDAIEYGNASEDEVIRFLYPHLFKHKDELSSLEKASARRKFKVQLKKARAMVKQDYLFLVPLDYLQEKSYFRDIRKKKAGESPPTDLST
jgi:hypothetical protein